MIRAATMAAAASFLIFWLTLLAAEVEAKPKDDDDERPAATATATSKKDDDEKTKTPAPAAATATPSPGGAAAGASRLNPGGSEFSILVNKRIYDPEKGTWKPATPAKSWSFEATDSAGRVVATFNDANRTTVQAPAGGVVIREATRADYEIYSLIRSTTGGSSCPATPTAGPTQVTLTPDDIAAAGSGTILLCAYNRGTRAATPKVSLTFVEAKAGISTWRLTPESDADMYIWDETAEGCTAFNGAVCGDIARGGRGTFIRATAGQSLVVTQPYTVNGESCEIEHQAEFALAASPDSRLDLTGRYRCSGAPVLGPWWLLIGFGGAVAVAWHVRRVRG